MAENQSEPGVNPVGEPVATPDPVVPEPAVDPAKPVDPVVPEPAAEPAKPVVPEPAAEPAKPVDPNAPIEIPDNLKEMGVDQELMKSLAPVMDALPEEKKGELVKLGETFQAQMQKNTLDHWTEQSDNWVDELKQDKVIGGEKFDGNMVKVNNLLRKFDTDNELSSYLTSIHHQNCAPLVKFLTRIVPHFSEDDLQISGDTGGKEEKAAYDKMGYKSPEEYAKK